MRIDALEERVEVLDRLDDEAVVLCPLALDARPAPGLAACVDWRSGGALARAFEADETLGHLGVVRPFPHRSFGRVRVLTVGHGSGPVEAELGLLAASLDDALATLAPAPSCVFASWPLRLAHDQTCAERWLAPFVERCASTRLCLVGRPSEVEGIVNLLLAAERRLLGKSAPFSFPWPVGSENS